MKDPGELAAIEALSHVGKRETTGNNDGEFVRRVLGGEEGLPWCAAFVLRCYEWSGNPLPVNFWKCRRVATLYDKLDEAGAMLNATLVRFELLRPGDLVFWLGTAAHAAAGASGHVGIVTGALQFSVGVVEGNAGNAVRKRLYDGLTGPRITAIARPSLLLKASGA